MIEVSISLSSFERNLHTRRLSVPLQRDFWKILDFSRNDGRTRFIGWH